MNKIEPGKSESSLIKLFAATIDLGKINEGISVTITFLTVIVLSFP